MSLPTVNDLSKKSSAINAVLRLAARGFRMFPLEPRGKRPIIPEWPAKATSDSHTLSEWHGEYAGCNWGLACGSGSHVFVLDIDGEEGAAAIQDLCRKHGDAWMETLTVNTASGRHLYFQYPVAAIVRNSAGKIAAGLDVRGEGGYVVVPPSIHPNGHRYSWLSEDALVNPAPAWLLDLVASPAQQGSGTFASSTSGSTGRIIVEGQRNATLTSLAGSMRLRGMTCTAIEAALLNQNSECCNPPLAEDEVRSIACSVSRYQTDSNGHCRSVHPTTGRSPKL
jgi:Bifunctional DNA primase/polymerase, N-terminal/Primase C terminal 1 (PriCT-1)